MSDGGPLVAIGKLFERLMEHAPGRRLPPEEWPAHLRVKCLACNDRGLEFYAHPVFKDRTYARPCIHCEEGTKVLAAWLAPAKEKGGRDGPWHGMSEEQISRIRALPCAHEPLPA